MRRLSDTDLRYKIMFIGDSITTGASGGTESLNAGGYRNSVISSIATLRGGSIKGCGWDLSGNLGVKQMCGIAGLRVDEMLNRTIVQLPAYQPNLVILHIGTNDCTQLYSGVWVGGSISLSITNLGTLLDHIRNSNQNTHVLIAKIIPNQTTGNNDQINLWNPAMTTAVSARSDAAFVHIVDQNGAFLANPSWATDYMNDATHPNTVGNATMATQWMNAYSAL